MISRAKIGWLYGGRGASPANKGKVYLLTTPMKGNQLLLVEDPIELQRITRGIMGLFCDEKNKYRFVLSYCVLI